MTPPKITIYKGTKNGMIFFTVFASGNRIGGGVVRTESDFESRRKKLENTWGPLWKVEVIVNAKVL